MNQQQLSRHFQQQFDYQPQWFIRSPGRVNLIGGHTDYNDGFVMPMALSHGMYLAMSPRQDSQIHLCSMNFDATGIYQIDLNHLEKSGSDWDEYVKGMAWALSEHYPQTLTDGFDAVIYSDVPIGAGLSSSAAFELAIARALATTNQLDWDAVQMAKLAQRAENQWIGVNCGIMDQMVIAIAKKNHAVLIDCRSLKLEYLPLPPNTVVVILDTATRRGLVDSDYNERRKQCEQAATTIGVDMLRDIMVYDLKQAKTQLDPTIFDRAYHVITENDRVLQAKQAMIDQDASALGQLIATSHHSLAHHFEVSNQALNVMADLANKHSACYGARMTGAGFGGCAVALVNQAQVNEFVASISHDYQMEMKLEPAIYVCTAEGGVDIMPMSL